MTSSKRSSLLVLSLALGGILAPAMKASADEAPAEFSTLPMQPPDLPVTVAYLVAVSPSENAAVPGEPALPEDPGAAMQEQVQSGAETAPAKATKPATDPLAQGRQTKRILFIVPNFRAVSADQQLPPQTVRDKLKTALLDSLDYSSFIFVGGQAAVAQANKSYPEFGQGAKGFGRYYWHTLADAINENTWVEFIIPSLLHEDTRYYTLGKGEFGKRIGYAFTRVVITRTDDGNRTFNFSEIAGAGAFAGVSNLYYPSQERTITKTYQRWVTNLAIDGCVFVFKEVWPDINNAVFHQKD